MGDIWNPKTGQFGIDDRFRLSMQPYAHRIYKEQFGCDKVTDLRADGCKVHILDKEFGIDSLLDFASGQWVSIQEKYRRNDALTNPRYRRCPDCPDFTQEWMNGAGTEHESPGEWFKLGAQLYFYGWANANETGFAAWVILNIPRYKLLVEASGGFLGLGGELKPNKIHGRASFWAIPIKNLRPAIIATHGLKNILNYFPITANYPLTKASSMEYPR